MSNTPEEKREPVDVDAVLGKVRNSDFYKRMQTEARKREIQAQIQQSRRNKGLILRFKEWWTAVQEAVLKSAIRGDSSMCGRLEALCDIEAAQEAEERLQAAEIIDNKAIKEQVLTQTARQDRELAEAEKFLETVNREDSPMLYVRFEAWKKANDHFPADRDAEIAYAHENPGRYRLYKKNLSDAQAAFNNTKEIYQSKLTRQTLQSLADSPQHSESNIIPPKNL